MRAVTVAMCLATLMALTLSAPQNLLTAGPKLPPANTSEIHASTSEAGECMDDYGFCHLLDLKWDSKTDSDETQTCMCFDETSFDCTLQ